MTNPSTIWAALALPISPIGNIPFVGLDGVSIQTDASDLYYAQISAQLTGSQRPKQLTAGGGLRVNFTDTTSQVSIAVTANTPAGRTLLPAGHQTVSITNSYIDADSLVFCQLEDTDATVNRVTTAVFSGFFNIIGNGVAGSSLGVAWVIVNVKTPV